MSIEYKYTIVSVNAEGRCMEVVYESEGHQTMHIGVRLAFEGERLEDVIEAFAPKQLWIEQQTPVVVPSVGASGIIADAPPVEEPISVEEKTFVAIFPTRATGSIDATVFE